MYVEHTSETVTKVVEETASGKALTAIAKSVAISPGTVRWWLYLGAPIDAPSIPRGTPLIIMALRQAQGVALDAPITDVERLTVLRMASQRRLHLTGQFLKYFAEYFADEVR